MKTRSHSPMIFLAFGLLVGLTPCLAENAPRLLLQHATKVGEFKHLALTCWLTEHTLLIVTSDKDRYDYPGDWTGRAQLLNTRTHRRTRLPGLTRMLQHWQWHPTECQVAGGGQWLFWWAWNAPDHYRNTLISTRNGTQHYRWQFTKGDDGYWLNDHVWIDQHRFHNSYEPQPLLDVHDVNHPTREHSLRVNAPATRTWIARQAAEPFVYADAHSKIGQHLHIAKYRIADYHLREKPQALQTYAVALPTDLAVNYTKVSPNNKTVLIVIPSGLRADLWTCRVNGSHLHRLGSVPRNADDYYLDIKWLPGSKKIAFTLGNRLYTMPVE